MNLSDSSYSCYDGSGMSRNAVTAELWESEDTSSRVTALVSASVSLLFILVGVPGNLLIVGSILRQKLYKEPTYVLLLNLAIVDCLMCLTVMPFTVVSGFAGGWIFGGTDYIRCKVCQLGIFLPLLGSLSMHLRAFLSLDRFVFIRFALKYHKLATGKRYTVLCIALWLFCSILVTPPLAGVGDLEFFVPVSACILKFTGRTRVAWNMLYTIFLAVELTIPITILMITNIWLLCIIYRQMRKLHSEKKSTNTARTFSQKIQSRINNWNNKKQWRLIKVFGGIWVASVISSLPFVVIVIGTAATGEIERFPNWILLIAFLGVISFPVSHPLIEAGLIPELRKYLTSFLAKVCCRRKNNYFEESYSMAISIDRGMETNSGRTSCFSKCRDYLHAPAVHKSTEV